MLRRIKATLLFFSIAVTQAVAQPLYEVKNDFVFYHGNDVYGVRELTLYGNFDRTILFFGNHSVVMPIPFIGIVGCVLVAVLGMAGFACWIYSRTRQQDD